MAMMMNDVDEQWMMSGGNDNDNIWWQWQ
jgi:hypothetical protein